jgi:hypothetical protein
MPRRSIPASRATSRISSPSSPVIPGEQHGEDFSQDANGCGKAVCGEVVDLEVTAQQGGH